MSDLDVQRCGRKCHETGRELLPGEIVFSALFAEQGRVVRRDFGAESWDGARPNIIGWWRTRIPIPQQAVAKMATPAVVVRRFEHLVDQGADPQLISVLGLVMVRKRWLREDDSPDTPLDAPVRRWLCPVNGRHFELARFHVEAQRADELQVALVELLYGEDDLQESELPLGAAQSE